MTRWEELPSNREDRCPPPLTSQEQRKEALMLIDMAEQALQRAGHMGMDPDVVRQVLGPIRREHRRLGEIFYSEGEP